ncbi:hypothetical protein [Streptomyces sp. NRRL S-87]|uniref:hypothetical protein n=1 Tax=Streptomyces sp. NRRL S-87 TaxID=1463920 RepID=UPI0004BFB0B4|nr:hypothetical protein [Streptomyces sp. NRRL S-87]
MNIRSLTRADGVVIGAAALLFIASFLDFYSVACGAVTNRFCDLPSAWDTDYYGIVLPAIFLTGFAAAALIIVGRALPNPPKFANLTLENWGTVLSVAALWSALWALMVGNSNLGPGAIIAFLAVLALAGVAVFGGQVPALKGPLLPAPGPQQAAPFGGQPGQPGQPDGYGYPGQAYGAQGAGPFGGPDQAGAQPHAPQHHQNPQDHGAQHQQPNPQVQEPAQPQQAAPAGDFAPFWFAVPVVRPLLSEDGSPAPVAELAPGTWYLAVEQRGGALVAQTQDGRRGVLQDTSGIQRG